MVISGCCVFFFQAEDGIRDGTVTGVQTCALPIFEHDRVRERLVLAPAAGLGPQLEGLAEPDLHSVPARQPAALREGFAGPDQSHREDWRAGQLGQEAGARFRPVEATLGDPGPLRVEDQDLPGPQDLGGPPEGCPVGCVTHDRKCVIAAEEPVHEPVVEVLLFAHAPAVDAGQEGRQQRWIDCRGVVSADQQGAAAGHVLDTVHLQETAGQVGPGDEAHQPAHEPVRHRELRRTVATIWSTTSSSGTPSVSITTASGAGFRGATERSESARSRSPTSCVMEAWSAGSPRRWNWAARRRTRSSRLAVRKNFQSASGKTTVPMSRPAITTPPPASWRSLRLIASRTSGCEETAERFQLISGWCTKVVRSRSPSRTRSPTICSRGSSARAARAAGSVRATPRSRASQATAR